jgi:hypothetical protein
MSRHCNLADGTPVSRATAERLLCTCRLTAVLEQAGPFGSIEIIGITDVLRDATAHQRKALAARDGGCAFPGCEAPPEWCDAHHLLPWDDGGVTLLENMALLCKHHHHLVHEGGWTLWRATDGLLHLLKPDGTPVPVTPHGHKVPLDAAAPVAPSPPPRRPGELRFLTPRERAARIAERDRRQREAANGSRSPDGARDIGIVTDRGERPPPDAPAPPTRGRGVFGPHQRQERRQPPRHGPPAA